MDLGLNGKKALVMGATGGLGGAVARQLHAEGAHVILGGRNVDRLQQLAKELSDENGSSILLADLADRESIENALGVLGPAGETDVDIFVANGGGPRPGSVLEVEGHEWSRSFEEMIGSVFALTRHVVPAMRTRAWGRILNIVSSGVQQPVVGLGMSNALRSALIGYAKTLAAEVAGDGVTVNSVLPGRIATDRLRQIDAANARRLGRALEDIVNSSKATIPIGRYGEREEFANMVAFLVSERASYVTGTQIRVDGGLIRSV
ncbi:SDR family oxidoreductase [Pelagibacterium luteolum]|uniref:3-oxoacyl-[acyl-carrier protein] reductase n=1 Tax=Pelagibacterium luteolum TaxID=440168 RepID=A0A1G7ZT13_9HYPH|nr:SDR family oxidoreductase [Pelagibacterium luteolum]SDH11260.1 3-oxoacyl-[acyl-carrier protein] reductase [Pelagibacterium luteolum]